MRKNLIVFGTMIICLLIIGISACNFGGSHRRTIHYKNKIIDAPCSCMDYPLDYEKNDQKNAHHLF